MKIILIYSFIVVFYCSNLKRLNAQSIQASPYPVEITQPDGSKILVLGKGDINFHQTETIDGYTIVKNSKGIYEYATKDADNNIVASGHEASNLKERTNNEIVFLNSISKGLAKKPFQKYEERYSSLKNALQTETLQNNSFPTDGTRKVLLLLIEYSDLESEYTSSDFNNMMNQSDYNNTGSFRDFYEQTSGGKLILDTDVFGWYVAANSFEYYGENNGDDVARELVAEAVDAAEAAGVDFSQYDNDGDGITDGIIVVHSGPGAESGAQTQYVWSHMSSLGNTYFRNYDGVIINDYMINPETRSWGMVGIGVFCHEFGHGLGLPDLYDADDSNGFSEGIGEWGLMGGGAWLNLERTPANMCAWSRIKMGWITPTVIYNGEYSLNASANSADVYKILTDQDNEYFLLENRQNIGQDEYLPGKGLAIWHIDDNQSDNDDEEHKLVDLEEADGEYDLDNENNRGDGGDLYPGTSNNSTFNKDSNPNSNLYSAAVSDVEITNITEENQTITFNLGTKNREPEIIKPFADIIIEEDFTDTTLSQRLDESIIDDEALAYEIILAGNSINAEIIENKIKLSSIVNKYGDNKVIVSANDGEYVTKDTFLVQLTPVNDYPVIENQTFSIAENSINGSVIGNIQASDVDDEDVISFSITNGNLNNTFTIDPTSGKLSVNDSSELDYEEQTKIDLTVEVQDNGEGNLKSEAIITVNILNIIDEPTGRNDLVSSSDIELYPVPVKEKLNIEFSKTITKKTVIALYNMAGMIVKLQEIHAPMQNKITLDCQDLSSGVYLLKVSSENLNTVKKIIKE